MGEQPITQQSDVTAGEQAALDLRGHSFGERLRAAIARKRTLAILSCVAVANFAVLVATETVFGVNCPAATAARVLSAIAVMLMATSLYLNMSLRVLSKLISRARCAHAHIHACEHSQTLHVQMRTYMHECARARMRICGHAHMRTPTASCTTSGSYAWERAYFVQCAGAKQIRSRL